MANVDPVASVTRTDAVQGMMGETQVRISSEAARELSKQAEAAGVTRKEQMERLIMAAAR
jgi:hypothetical protein